MNKRAVFYVFVIVAMLAGALPLPRMAASPSDARATQAPPKLVQPPPPGGEGAPNPMGKLDAELQTLAAQASEEPVTVYILAKPGAELGDLASVTEKRPYIGDELIVAKVKPAMLAKLASRSDVLAAKAFHPVEPPVPITPRERAPFDHEQIRQLRQQASQMRAAYQEPRVQTLTAEPVLPMQVNAPSSWYGKDVIGASAAWAKGYTGAGVNIAIVDSGVDFGHPDLAGKQAVYENGPYAGWPIALDPRSMRNYYYYGYTSSNNYTAKKDYSWYADVYHVLHCTQGTTPTFQFNGYTYSLAPEVVALSKSGEIRWGIHPDVQLYNFVWDWVPFILLDAKSEGVYDTVIADLNFDLWFDRYDKVANKADPVLNQDLGAYLTDYTYVATGTMYVPAGFVAAGNPPIWWGPPQDDTYGPVTTKAITLPAGTWVWAPNHWTPKGATTRADGIADVSGGMVYYIADGKLPIPGMDYLYPRFGPAGMNPIPFNGQLVAFMLGSLYVSGGNHGTLCASAAAAGGQITDPRAATGEQIQFAEQLHPLQPIRVGILGGARWAIYNRVVNDPYLMNAYVFEVVGNDWTYAAIRNYDMLIVNETDNGLTIAEAQALQLFYDTERPILLGMDDMDEASSAVLSAVNHVFGVANPHDGDFAFGTITQSLSAHPIARGITFIGSPGFDNDYYEADGAEWVVRGQDGANYNNYVLAYDGTARTVIMGERLDQWYDAAGDGKVLVRNAIDWAAASARQKGASVFFDDFSSTANWTWSGLWHSDLLADHPETTTLSLGPYPPVFTPTMAFNQDGVITPTYSGSGALTLKAPVQLPDAESIELSFWSYEQTEQEVRHIVATRHITIGIVGANSAALYAQLVGDPRLASYSFVDAGDNFTSTAALQPYAALLVAESFAGLTVSETQSLQAFYTSGKPIVLGMTGVQNLTPAQQTALGTIFGVRNAGQSWFQYGSVSNHPMAQLVWHINSLGSITRFNADGAEWVVRGTNGQDFVLAKEGAARTVIMGASLDTWYANSWGYDPTWPGPWEQGQLVSNAIIWAVEGIPQLQNPNTYDIRYVEFSTDNGATWYRLWDSTNGSVQEEWYQQTYDLSAYAGHQILIRFRFDSVDTRYNNYLGWYVDNVRIQAQGARRYLKPVGEGTVQGPAPDARIIAIGSCYDVINDMQGFYDAYTFLAYGVDGRPNSGDEFVDVVSMSFGDGYVHNDGWDFDSRLLTYYNQNYLPNTAMLSSSGNGGHGFGTVNSPKGTTLIDVGASTQYGGTDVFGGGLTLEQINQGDIQPFSGRGPSALGRPDPHVVANGAWGTGDVPLNATYYYGASAGVPYLDGGNAWYEWGGTSRSAPEAAGVMALLYHAYYSATATMPTYETAREILMSSADDLSHDVLMQGAGRVNADRATDVAAGLDGIYVSPSLLAAGRYNGARHDAFANVLYPGDTWTHTFTIYNTGSTTRSVSVSDHALQQVGVITYSVVVSPYLGVEDLWLDAYYNYAHYFVVADPAKSTITNTLGITHAIHGDSLVVPVPANAELMQVQLLVPFELYAFDYTEPNPVTNYSTRQRWSLTVYDWTDRNGDGKLWEDANGDGIVNPQSYGWPEVVDISALDVTTQTEINRFAYSYLNGNEQEVTVRLTGSDRTGANKPNIVLGIVHRYHNNTRPGWGAQEYQENPLLVKVIFYGKADWNLVTASPASLNVPAGGSATFVVTFTVPADQAPGLYEGALAVNDGAHTSIIPTTVNVAAPKDKLLFELGGTARAGTPYDNGRGFGAWAWSGRAEAGDWRFFYYDANAGFEQQYLFVRNQWGKLCGNMPTFYETLVWGPNRGDPFSLKDPATFGPYGLQYVGGTYNANYGGLPRYGRWWYNGDGTPMPESRSWATLWDGLNQVQFRNVLLSGQQYCGEGFAATAGVFGVDAPGYYQDGIVINTTSRSGSFTLNAVSPVEGLLAYARGFGQEQFFKSVVVPQGKHTNFPPDDLLTGWVYTFTATNLGGIQAELDGPGSSDVDLYLLYDANKDGIFNVYDNREFVAASTGVSSNELISYYGGAGIPFVADGLYALVLYGYRVYPGDRFNLRLSLIGGDNLRIVQAVNHKVSANPGVPIPLTVEWQVPGPGIWHGYLWFGMPWEGEPQYRSQGPGIYVPVTINKEGAIPGIKKAVSQRVAEWGDILVYTVTVKNTGSEVISMDVADLLPQGIDLLQSSITVTLPASPTLHIPDLNAFWYNARMRTLYWSLSLPIEHKGEIYTEASLVFKARVEAQPGTRIRNTARLKWYGSGGFMDTGDDEAEPVETIVPVKVYLPVVLK